MTDGPVPAGEDLVPDGTGAGAHTQDPPGIVADFSERDGEVLALREQGRSFASIARALGLEGASPANAAFNRALRRLPPSDQETLRSHEMARLDGVGRTAAPEAGPGRSGNGSARPQPRTAPQEAERVGRRPAGQQQRRCASHYAFGTAHVRSFVARPNLGCVPCSTTGYRLHHGGEAEAHLLFGPCSH